MTTKQNGGNWADVIRDSFDQDYYLSRYPDVELTGIDPLIYFAYWGWKELHDPNPWFSTKHYLEENPDIAGSGINPLFHFIAFGKAEGRSIRNSDFTSENTEYRQDDIFEEDCEVYSEALVDQWELDTLAKNMDFDFYETQLQEKGASVPRQNFAHHYLTQGSLQELDPVPWFSTRYYAAVHPDVVEAGVNVFVHYIVTGKAEGRALAPSGTEALAVDADFDLHSLVAADFDSHYYLNANDDVAESGIDALTHFMEAGWREGRDPNRWFSVRDYLELNIDVAEAGVNPFAHYIQTGKAEGRVPRLDLGYRYSIIDNCISLSERKEIWKKTFPPKPTTPIGNLITALSDPSISESSLFISVSHDNYDTNIGGVQLCIQREVTRAREKGYVSLHLYPARAALLTHDQRTYSLGLILNGEHIGYFSSNMISKVVQLQRKSPLETVLVIHSLLGHSPKALSRCLRSIGISRAFYWVHDYSSICGGFNLLRNDVEYCGVPVSDSGACRICVYGEWRDPQREAHEHLMQEFSTTILAPSEKAAEIWQAAGEGKQSVRVYPHCELSRVNRTGPTSHADSPIKVGFLGHPAGHKGWDMFVHLANKFADDHRYEFVHIGQGRQKSVPTRFVDVRVSSENLNAMVNAVLQEGIDIALIWSLWPETFCFTAYEAAAAGAAILTHQNSGNVARFTDDNALGVIFESDDALVESFASGQLSHIVADVRSRPGFSLKYSDLTADFL